MKFRKLVNIVLVVLALGIAIIIARDFVMNRAGKVIENPYAFDVSEYAKVSVDEILYEEEKVLQLRVAEPKGIAFHQGTLFVIADSSLLQMNLQGQLLQETKLEASPTAIAVDDLVWLGMKNQVVCLNFDGQEVERWENYGGRSVITSLAVSPDFVFVADAGNRLVYQCKRMANWYGRLAKRMSRKQFRALLFQVLISTLR